MLFTHMLSTISSAHMDEVGFKLIASDVDLLGWDEIDAALQHSSFSGLRTVEVRLVQWPDLDAGEHLVAISRIKDLMPRCHARGILDTRGVVRQYFLPPDQSFEGALIDST